MNEASYATTEWLYKQYGFINSRETSAFTSRVTARLANAISETALKPYLSSTETEEFRNFPWQVFLVNSGEPNAFSVGGGAIFVTAGLLEACQSEAELAAIISHEMAHQLLGHPQLALERGDVGAETPQYSFNLDEELSADTLGLRILTVARYDGRHALGSLMLARRFHDRQIGTDAGEVNWLESRSANLEQELQTIGVQLPATETTREFARVKEYLLKVASSG